MSPPSPYDNMKLEIGVVVRRQASGLDSTDTQRSREAW